jgi:hypothetical protein
MDDGAHVARSWLGKDSGSKQSRLIMVGML